MEQIYNGANLLGPLFYASYPEGEKTMNIRALSDWKASGLPRIQETAQMAGFPGPRPATISRRRFARTAAGTAFVGAIGSRLWKPARAEAATFAPVPIPGGTPALGGSYHVFAPAALDPIDAEPATINNMDGFVGLAYISGMVTQTNTGTGQVSRYPFVGSDMRFMQGVFRGTDGQVHQGAFALV